MLSSAMPPSLLRLALVVVIANSLWAAPPGSPSSIPPIDPTLGASAATVDASVIWNDVTTWGVEGREWIAEDRLSWFDRLPAAAQKTVTPNVWSLSRDCTGMMVRFKTDATSIYVHYKLTKEALAKPSMPATGVSGIDLYARDGKGAWRWVQVTKPGQRELKVELVKELAPGSREYAAYLPLQNGVEFVRIGVPVGAKFEGLVPRAQPVVFYGTSITHGVCASRPGMVHTAILGRHLDMPVVNLGFAGNGRMDAAVGDYLVKIDAAAYVIDCLPNMNPTQVTERTVPFVKQLRAVKPETPIILVEDRRNTNEWILPAKASFHNRNHAALKACFEQLQQEGVRNLHYVSGDELYGTDSEGSTDGSHASDLGFMRQAAIMEPVLRAALKR